MPNHSEMAVTPDSGLAKLLARLERRDRRLLLATVQCAPGPRRKRLTKEMHRRLRDLGLE